MPRCFPVEPLSEYSRRLAPLVEDLRQAALLPPQREEALLTGPVSAVANLLRLVGPLPASEAHHDSGPLGLVIHSLRVAQEALRLLAERCPRPTTAGDGFQRWERLQTLILLGGLAHDVAKVLTLEVWCDDRSWSAQTPLLPWCERHGLDHLLVRHRPLPFGPRGHEPLASLFLPRFIPWQELADLGRGLNDLLAALCRSLGAVPGDPLAQLIAAADRNVACTPRPASDIPACTAHRHYAPGQESLASDFIAGFRIACEQRQLSANTTASPLVISDTHTILFLNGRNQVSALRRAFEAMRARCQDLEAGGWLRAFYGEHGSPQHYLPELALRTTSDGLSWCVMATNADGLSLSPGDDLACVQAIRHFVVVSDATCQLRRADYAIIMRNSILWGDAGPDVMGTFPGYVACFHEDRRTPSYEVADLGFLPFPTPSPARVPRPLQLTALAAGSSRSASIDDWASITARLVHLVHRLPSRPDATSDPLWNDLQAAIGDRVPEPLLQTALEAVYDRLRALDTGGIPQQRPQGLAPSRPAAPRPEALDADLAREVHRAVCLLVASCRSTPATAQLSIAPRSAQAIIAPDGAILLPWPRCLDGLLKTPHLKLVADGAGGLLAGLGLPAPALWRVEGMAYGGLANGTRGCLVPPQWRPPMVVAPISIPLASAGVQPATPG